ncbi:unnamed protein product [Rotaria socialis]|uniref:Transmembrane protein 163 n=1 Tax=Rotaria socialis TaxID=392032 RepID=A0A817SA61_9BILA|nr:unnamed protein product [Rotaria socialis]CAF3313626.1 unnamed protein product [Rotaria socialis]CAF4136321.1 unnamed protein product [Rotaria socialis]CAF4266587.1 unnamed protein product [Rotaria socialis]
MLFNFPECLFPKEKYEKTRMRVFPLTISWISIIYNAIEGNVSIGLGVDVMARALIVFSIQSLVEMLSAALAVYRFRREIQNNSSINSALEKRANLGIGILLMILALGTRVASIMALVTRVEPNSSKPSLIVSAASLFLMIFVWLPKSWIAAELNSSLTRDEAACYLACICLTIVLFIGSLVYKLWLGGWWIDSAIAIALEFFFLHEGCEMIAWARNKNFNGGCCKACFSPVITISFSNPHIMPYATNCGQIEKCECSTNKTECKWMESFFCQYSNKSCIFYRFYCLSSVHSLA